MEKRRRKYTDGAGVRPPFHYDCAIRHRTDARHLSEACSFHRILNDIGWRCIESGSPRPPGIGSFSHNRVRHFHCLAASFDQSRSSLNDARQKVLGVLLYSRGVPNIHISASLILCSHRVEEYISDRNVYDVSNNNLVLHATSADDFTFRFKAFVAQQ